MVEQPSVRADFKDVALDRPVPKARRGLGVSLPEAVVGAWVVGLAGFVIIGADLMWTVAMGDTIRRDGAIPDGIPFASAPQRDWSNPAVVGDLLLSTVNSAGWWALTAFHLALVAGALLVVVADARRLGAGPGRLAAVVSVLVIGCASPFVVARYPSLSLVPFVVLVWVLRRQSERASRAVWWVPPLVVLWGNLHGAVLVGVAVLGVWVVAGRGPSFLQRALVGLASLSTLVLTSAGLRTPDYYLGVLRNEAAVRRSPTGLKSYSWRGRPRPAHQPRTAVKATPSRPRVPGSGTGCTSPISVLILK